MEQYGIIFTTKYWKKFTICPKMFFLNTNFFGKKNVNKLFLDKKAISYRENHSISLRAISYDSGAISYRPGRYEKKCYFLAKYGKYDRHYHPDISSPKDNQSKQHLKFNLNFWTSKSPHHNMGVRMSMSVYTIVIFNL